MIVRERKKIRCQENERMSVLLQQVLIHTTQTNENQFALGQSNKIPLFEEKLRLWSCENRISKRAVDGLLSILISAGMKTLPKNHRTLQRTPTNIEIFEIAGSKLWHNGLTKCLKNVFSTLDRDIAIQLNFNIDGLPIYNSSKLCFYPILASIHGMMNILKLNLIYCSHSIQF